MKPVPSASASNRDLPPPPRHLLSYTLAKQPAALDARMQRVRHQRDIHLRPVLCHQLGRREDGRARDFPYAPG